MSNRLGIKIRIDCNSHHNTWKDAKAVTLMICSICKMDSCIDSSSPLQRSWKGLLSIHRWSLQLAGGILLFWRIRGSISPNETNICLSSPPVCSTNVSHWIIDWPVFSVQWQVYCCSCGRKNLSKSGLTNTNLEILKWEPLLSGLSVIWERNRPSKKE